MVRGPFHKYLKSDRNRKHISGAKCASQKNHSIMFTGVFERKLRVARRSRNYSLLAYNDTGHGRMNRGGGQFWKSQIN